MPAESQDASGRGQCRATGNEQLVATCDSIRAFLTSWVLPFLSEVSTPSELVKLYETNDAPVTSVLAAHLPSTSFCPAIVMPSARYTATLATCPLSRTLPQSA